ncbi:hypothetical protein AB0C81_26965 [Streptomyces roseoverticillatus]|uniref:hypothetical protein n=1 Tax=Streptomyces roseoverticillatus TaxID=66429 RepID=UPI0033E5F0F8
MNTTRTTPPRPVDVTAVFPELAPLARTATRLHPRPGAPSPQDSSIGGPLLWPADEPWPHCDGPHTDGSYSLEAVQVERRVQARVAMNPDDPRAAHYTPEEVAVFERLQRIDFHDEWPEGPVAMLPVAQLYARDIPLLRTLRPSGADLLQVLWCPLDHPEEFYTPRTAVVWRSAADVTDILTSPPKAHSVEFEEYVPVPCVLAPEEVTEYPNSMELSKELQEQLSDWSSWQAAAGVDSSYASYPELFYRNHLSIAPGWKVGGWPQWGYTDPAPRPCPACGTAMDPLLTIATFEWNAEDDSWIPHEVQAASSTGDHRRDVVQPTRVQIGSGYKQQLYICPAAPEHPHIELMQ